MAYSKHGCVSSADPRNGCVSSADPRHGCVSSADPRHGCEKGKAQPCTLDKETAFDLRRDSLYIL